MDFPPGRAPYDEKEDYTPMRLPKSNAYAPLQTNSINSMNASFEAQLNLSSPAVQRTISPSKLSHLAPAFEPSKHYNENAQYFQNHQHLQQQQQLQQQQHHHQQRQQHQIPQHPHLNQHQNHHQKNSRPQYQEQHQHQHQNQQQQYQHQQQFNNRQSNNYQSQERQKPFSHQNRNHHHHHQQQQHNHHQHQNHSYDNGFEQHHHHLQQQQQQQYQQQQQQFTSRIQNRLKVGAAAEAASASNYAASNNYNNYHHSGQRQQQSYQHPTTVHNNSGIPQSPTSATEFETIALDYLQSCIQCLNQNPGQFDSVATRFLTIFEGMENNNYVLCNAMEDVFKESIDNPNFRYMGAKLYNLLHMLNLKKDSLFQQLLKCKLDYHQEEQIEFMQDPKKQQKVRETALFLAELYMQLRGDDSRIHLIAENIVFSLKQLLSKVTADNVRCICLTLKLAGYDLTADCPEDMKKIIEQLETINSENHGKFPLAANVISLQKNNWGRKLSSSSSSVCDEEEKSKTAEPLRASDEPIFYGPDGRELTSDEADFLTSNANVMPTGTSSNDEDDVADLDVDFDPEMDEESEQAYKEFCKQRVTS